MSERLQPVRGTQDLLPAQCQSFRFIDERAYALAQRFGYGEIRTPIFEFSEVFHRTLGETSDMVSKETYTFLDRGNESITLRPEGTAGIARAFISNGLAQELPLKYYYFGPMFRYERPQKGRYRQFHQIGVESLGSDDAQADVECISLGYLILKELGLANNVSLELNSLGDVESRQKHRDLLVSYLNKYEKDLSAESQVRLQKNPLRILDSKDEKDRKILQSAPGLASCLNSESQAFAEKVQKGLLQLGINFQINERLVRGIDYYTHTVFEFVTKDLGAQGAVIAGGRYNGLIGLMGGQDTPGIGWAAGVERLALLLEGKALSTKTSTLIAVLAADESGQATAAKLSFDLRQAGHRVENILSGNMGKKMKRAAKIDASYAVILGENEIKSGQASVKNMGTGEQKNIPLAELIHHFKI